jgi:hypothetical protein
MLPYVSIARYSDMRMVFAWLHEANIIYLNRYTHTYTHTHTNTHRPTTVLVDIFAVYIFVLHIFFLLYFVSFFCATGNIWLWNFMQIKEFFLVMTLLLLLLLLLPCLLRLLFPCTEYIFHLYLQILDKSRVRSAKSVVFFFNIDAILIFRHYYSTSQLLIWIQYSKTK